MKRFETKLDDEYDVFIKHCEGLRKTYLKKKRSEGTNFRATLAAEKSDEVIINHLMNDQFFVSKLNQLFKEKFICKKSKKCKYTAVVEFCAAKTLPTKTAVSHLSEAILFSPQNRLLLPMLKKRIKCNYDLESIDECLQDIKMMLQFSLDKKAISFVKTWRSLCLQKLLMKSGISVLDIKADGNEQMEDACKEMEVFVHSEKGRCVKATEDMNNGKVLVAQDPVVAWLRPSLYPYYCNNCFSKLRLRLYPCPKCVEVRYCSIKCQKQAWKQYHSIECRYTGTLKNCSIGMMALRMGTIYGIQNMMKAEERKEQEESKRFGNNCQSVVSLVSSFGYSDPSYRMSTLIGGILMAKLAQLMSVYNTRVSFCKNAAFLAKCITKVVVNCYYIYDEKVTATEYWDIISTSTSTFEIGIGLYSTASMFSHSCNSNAYRFCMGSKIIVLTSSPVKKGDELCIDYGIKFFDDCFVDRQEFLKSTFGFRCKCTACVDVLENIHYSIRCQACDGYLILSNATGSNYCVSCGFQNQDVTDHVKQVASGNKYSNIGKIYMKTGRYSEAIKYFEKTYDVYKKNFCYPTFDDGMVRTLAVCYKKSNEFNKAYDLYLHHLVLDKLFYGTESFAYLTTLFQLIDVLLEKHKRSKVNSASDEKSVLKAMIAFEHAMSVLRKITSEFEVKSTTKNYLRFLNKIHKTGSMLEHNLVTVLT